MATPGGDDPRRRGATLLLGAARQAFAARGYTHSSTREIAEAAGVSEALLFRYFGTKAKLFELAIVAPFQRLMDAHVADLGRGDDVGWLYDLLSENRDLVLALLAAQAHELNLSDQPELAAALGRLHVAAELELAVRGLDGVEVPAPVPVTFAMVFAMAVFADWLFPVGRQPSRDDIVREITHCLREGIVHHDPID